jgi:HlyD family secretion protein
MSKQLRLYLKIIMIALAFLALVWAFLPQPVKVDMEAVGKGDLLIGIEAEGITRIHDIYTVSTPIEGRITRIEIEPGAIVQAGETVLANMFPANPRFLDERAEMQAKADVEGARAALALARAKVRQAQAQLDYEQANFKRSMELYKKNLLSTAELESGELRITTLKAELETAVSNEAVMQARLDAAQAILTQPDKSNEDFSNSGHCHICIHSPVDGHVLRILHKSEGIIPVGTPLVEIGNPQDLEVKIEMLSVNAVKVVPGDEAIIKRWGGDDIRARVRQVEPSGFTKVSALGVEEQRVNVILDLIDPLEKWQSLGDAFRVEAEIIIERADNVLLVPLSALFRDNEQWSVFKVEQGTARLQSVTPGRKNDYYAEIIEGLHQGDVVIVHPGNDVAEGVSVIAR